MLHSVVATSLSNPAVASSCLGTQLGGQHHPTPKLAALAEVSNTQQYPGEEESHQVKVIVAPPTPKLAALAEITPNRIPRRIFYHRVTCSGEASFNEQTLTDN